MVKTVNFEYDYSSWGKVLNNKNYATDTSSTVDVGKLTLKKVWIDYNGTYDVKVSPYEFEYQYPETSDANYPWEYDQFEDYGSGLNETPFYSAFDVDAWGNYQKD